MSSSRHIRQIFFIIFSPSLSAHYKVFLDYFRVILASVKSITVYCIMQGNGKKPKAILTFINKFKKTTL